MKPLEILETSVHHKLLICVAMVEKEKLEDKINYYLKIARHEPAVG